MSQRAQIVQMGEGKIENLVDPVYTQDLYNTLYLSSQRYMKDIIEIL